MFKPGQWMSSVTKTGASNTAVPTQSYHSLPDI